jgi:hypothetical protein
MTRRIGFIAALWIIFCVWTLWGWLSVRSMAPMAYTVMERAGGYDVRRNEPFVVAQIPVTGLTDPLLERSSGIAREYVRGNNITLSSMAGDAEPSGEALARSVPTLVYQQRGTWFVASILPPELRIMTVPRPNDPRIRLVEVPAQTVAVLSLRGDVSPDDISAKGDALLAMLAADGRIALSSVRVIRLYTDSTPAFLRRTELHVTLRDSGR